MFRAMGSVISVVVDYAMWLVGCNRNQNVIGDSQNLVPYARPLVIKRRG